jgi:hypothetical protein
MNCKKCNRELKDESNYCDNCGNPVKTGQLPEKEFDTNFLIGSILFSIIATFAVTAILAELGMPIIFGGLFLPFFWNLKKKIREDK